MQRKQLISSYRELDVYKMALDGAIHLEAWRKRRYEAAFVSKLSDAETEAAETQVWAEVAFRCGYWREELFQEIDRHYDRTIGKLVQMIDNPRPWLIVPRTEPRE